MVPIQIPINIGLRCKPSNIFRCPWIFRALISLNKVIITNVLNIMVKCCVGEEWSTLPRPSGIPNILAPEIYRKITSIYVSSFSNYREYSELDVLGKTRELNSNQIFNRDWIVPYITQAITYMSYLRNPNK